MISIWWIKLRAMRARIGAVQEFHDTNQKLEEKVKLGQRGEIHGKRAVEA